MSLYNMVMDVNPCTPVLLELVKIDPRRIPRFRDVILASNHVGLLTRTGGKNRATYVAENAYLRSLPSYRRDQDDPFDSTFAWFWFELPADQWAFAAEHLQEGRERGPKAMVALGELCLQPDADLTDPYIARAKMAAEAMAAAFKQMSMGKPPGDVSVGGYSVSFTNGEPK